jgi:hypothetical protein
MKKGFRSGALIALALVLLPHPARSDRAASADEQHPPARSPPRIEAIQQGRPDPLPPTIQQSPDPLPPAIEETVRQQRPEIAEEVAKAILRDWLGPQRYSDSEVLASFLKERFGPSVTDQSARGVAEEVQEGLRAAGRGGDREILKKRLATFLRMRLPMPGHEGVGQGPPDPLPPQLAPPVQESPDPSPTVPRRQDR